MSLIVAGVLLVALTVLALVLGFTVEILFYLAFGLVIGVIARVLVPGKQHMNIWMTALVGAIGSVFGGVLADLTNMNGNLQFIPSLLLAIVLVAMVGGWNNEQEAVEETTVVE